MKIGLISCTKRKRQHPCKAKEMYRLSVLFRKAWNYAETHYDKTFILSAKYGLLDPENIIESYNETLNNMKKIDRIRWTSKVYDQLKPLLKEGDVVYFHAGKKYREPLAIWLGNLCKVKIPLKGLGIGQQLAWYSHFLTKDDKE